MSESNSRSYTYCLTLENGSYYVSSGKKIWDKIYVHEHIKESNGSISLSSEILCELKNNTGFFKRCSSHADLDSKNKLSSLRTIYFKENHPEPFIEFETGITIRDNTAYCVTKRWNVHKKNYISGSKIKNIPGFNAIGMFHYYTLIQTDFAAIIHNIQNGNNPMDYIGYKINSLEVSPMNPGISFWELTINEFKKETIQSSRGNTDCLKIIFHIRPPFFIRFMMKILRIKPELNFWLSLSESSLVRLEEYSLRGEKVIYQLI